MEQNRKELDRRGFLKKFGLGAAAVSAASLYGCAGKKSVGNADNSPEIGEVPKDQMTYRSFPGLGGDKASILGYGCMRWPVIPNPDGEGEIIDQE